MSEYKRLTNNNLEEYDPEYDFCMGCEFYGKYHSCDRPNGICANFERFIETYNRLAELEDMIDDGRLWFTPSNGLRPNPYECAKRWEELWYEANCQLNTLKNKIKNGTLIELPCKVEE